MELYLLAKSSQMDHIELCMAYQGRSGYRQQATYKMLYILLQLKVGSSETPPFINGI
jgi:hypothetical protein